MPQNKPNPIDTATLVKLDHDHVWHPFTPMRQWRETDPLIIQRGQGDYLFDTQGNRYIDGVSSLWCNVHGHRVPEIDQAVHDQLDQIAHTTLLGLASPPSIELAAALARQCERLGDNPPRKVFYSDAGATALEVAFKMAVGYWYHQGQPQRHRFIGLRGAYHGDTTGAMSIGYSELFHRPFLSMVFPTEWFANPDAPRAAAWAATENLDAPPTPAKDRWPSEDPDLASWLLEHCLADLRRLLEKQADQTAAVVIEPVMQGAAGMICQPPGFVKKVRALCDEYQVLLIADEVATGFGRTGTLFACEHDQVTPDILCLAKGITGGYLPLAATLCTDQIDAAFCGQLADRRTLYHGHTYTGNPLACAAALASLALFDRNDVLNHACRSSKIIADHLSALRDHPHILDIRQRGLMVGIELCEDRQSAKPFDFAARTAARVCMNMRPKGLLIRPLGDVMVLMPMPAMDHNVLHEMMGIVVEGMKNDL